MRNIALSILFVIYTANSVIAQNKSFNLNDPKIIQLKDALIPQKSSSTNFSDATLSREFALNPIVQSKDYLQINDTIILDLFSDKQYRAYIDKIDLDVNGSLTVRARMVNYQFGYCVISSFNGKSFMTVEVPENNELFMSRYNPQTKKYFLLQIDKTKQKFLEGSEPITPPSQNMPNNSSNKNLPQDLFITQQLKSAPVVSGNTVKSQSLINNTTTRDTITVMIVYTPAAALWSRNNETDINNTISQIMTTSQLALDNSNSLITLKLVYSAQVNYTELNNANDLYNLTEFGDGMMEDVQTWRDAYCADVVVLLENIEFTGGLGWQLNSASGLPDYAFSLNRVQQASFSYTTIHEIAHNLGCHHHMQQILEPGPGLNSYSAGWRWTSPSGITYCSVMTSPEGKYFADGKSSIRVPYFSNPDIQYQGIPVGNAVDADNA